MRFAVISVLPSVSSGDSIDWQEPDPETIVERVQSGTESGSILLFHNDLENTTQALPQLIKELKKSGYEFVAVGDLVYSDSYHIDSTGKQIHDVSASASPFLNYTDNQTVNRALETINQNMTFEEITNLIADDNPIEKIAPLLDDEQIAALSQLTDEELTQAFNILAAAVSQSQQTDPSGDKAENDASQTTASSAEATPEQSSQTTAPVTDETK